MRCIFYQWLWSCLQLLFRVFRAMPNARFCSVSCEVGVGCRQVISKRMKAMSATADEGIDAAYLFMRTMTVNGSVVARFAQQMVQCRIHAKNLVSLFGEKTFMKQGLLVQIRFCQVPVARRMVPS